MRVAYADPPYIGQARKHYKDDPKCAEVDHAGLIAQLESDYDGWALSASPISLPQILPLCPPGIRICAWVKPWCSWKAQNPAYCWEAVIIKQPRKSTRSRTADFIAENATRQRGVHGAKPERFCYWLFEILNLCRGDELVDLFPGSQIVLRSWVKWEKQAPIARGRRPKEQKQLILLRAV